MFKYIIIIMLTQNFVATLNRQLSFVYLDGNIRIYL